MMRLKDWRATKRVVPNLAEEMKEYDDAPMKPGVMYHGNVWIQGPLANGEYWLLIERSEYTGPLDSLEMILVFDIPGPSLSVGGIVTLNGRKFLCQPTGWEEVKS